MAGEHPTIGGRTRERLDEMRTERQDVPHPELRASVTEKHPSGVVIPNSGIYRRLRRISGLVERIERRIRPRNGADV